MTQTINAVPTGKSQGIDGLNSTYYKTYQEEWVRWLMKTFNAKIEGATLSEEALGNQIIVISKVNKDSGLCNSYSQYH